MRDIPKSPFQDHTSIYQNEQTSRFAYPQKTFIKREPELMSRSQIAFKNSRRETQTNRFFGDVQEQSKPGVSVSDKTLEGLKRHIRIATFCRFTQTAITMLIKFILLQEFIAYFCGSIEVQTRLTNIWLLILTFGYIFSNTLMYTEIIQAQSCILLIKELWQQPLLIRPMLLRIIMDCIILSSIIKAKSLITFLAIGIFNLCSDYLQRNFQVAMLNQGLLQKSAIELITSTFRQEFNFKKSLAIYSIVIFAFEFDHHLRNSVVKVISLLSIRLSLTILNKIFRYPMLDSRPLKFPDFHSLTHDLNLISEYSVEPRLSLIALKDLESLLASQLDPINFRNFIKDPQNLVKLTAQMMKVTQESLESVKQLREQSKLRLREWRQMQKYDTQRSQEIRNPQWFDKFGIDGLNVLAMRLHNYVQNVQDLNDLKMIMQRMQVLAQIQLQLVRYFVSTPIPERLFSPDQFDEKILSQLTANLAKLYADLQDFIAICRDRVPKLYLSSHKEIAFMLLSMHSSIQRVFNYGVNVKARNEWTIEQNQRSSKKVERFDPVREFKCGLI